MNDEHLAQGGDMAAALIELLRRFEAGEVQSAALRIQHADGTWQDVALGFTNERERDEALAKLRRMLGQLH